MATTTKRRPTRAHTARTATTERADVRAEVTARIIAALEAGTAVWQQPWSSAIGRPLNMETGNAYTGVNPLLLGMTTMERGYTSRWWGTFKQIQALGGNVKAGQNKAAGLGGTTLIKVGTGFSKTETDPVTGDPAPYTYRTAFTVFNAEQCEGLPERFYPAQVEAGLTTQQLADAAVAAAEAMTAGYLARPGAPVFLTEGVKATYRPSQDTIRMPAAGRFASPEHYCLTRFHELTHSTGHTTRLNREGVGSQAAEFGCEKYGKEELVAEMGAAMLAAEAGITADVLDDSAAYVASWLETIKGDPSMVVEAASAASKALDLILGVTR